MLFWDNFIGLHRGDFSPRESGPIHSIMALQALFFPRNADLQPHKRDNQEIDGKDDRFIGG